MTKHCIKGVVLIHELPGDKVFGWWFFPTQVRPRAHLKI